MLMKFGDRELSVLVNFPPIVNSSSRVSVVVLACLLCLSFAPVLVLCVSVVGSQGQDLLVCLRGRCPGVAGPVSCLSL